MSRAITRGLAVLAGLGLTYWTARTIKRSSAWTIDTITMILQLGSNDPELRRKAIETIRRYRSTDQFKVALAEHRAAIERTIVNVEDDDDALDIWLIMREQFGGVRNHDANLRVAEIANSGNGRAEAALRSAGLGDLLN